MNVFINKDGYVASPYILDATIDVEITDEQAQQIHQVPYGKAWKYSNGSFESVYLLTDEHLREARECECFKIVDNKSQMWYNNLTSDQLSELNIWYQAWLNVTSTHVVPDKPTWLK